MAKKTAKKVSKRAVKRTKRLAKTIVVGKKTRSDQVIEMRVPKDLLTALAHRTKNGEIRIGEDELHQAVCGPSPREAFRAMDETNEIMADLPFKEAPSYSVELSNGHALSGVRFKTEPSYDPREESKKSSILLEAQEVIFGDREKTNGSPDLNLVTIGQLWTVYLNRKNVAKGTRDITADDVCQMMILLKTARLINDSEHRDSLVDQAGYAALQQRIHDERPF